MKWNFLYQITAASRTPDQGATDSPSDPRSLCPLSSTEFVEPPPEQNSWVRHWITVEASDMLHCLELWDIHLIKEVTNYVVIIDIEFSVSSTNHIRKWTRFWVISIPILYSFQIHYPLVILSAGTVRLFSISFPSKILYASLRHCIVLTFVNELFKLRNISFCNILTSLLVSPFLARSVLPHIFVSRCLHVTCILISHKCSSTASVV